MKLLTLTATALLAALTLVPARAQAPMTVPSSPILLAREGGLPPATTGDTGGAAFVRDSLDAYIRRGMAAWNIPGLAVAIVSTLVAAVTSGRIMDVWIVVPVSIVSGGCCHLGGRLGEALRRRNA